MKTTKPYTQMSAAELAEATRQYEGVVIDKTRPLNARERKLWEQAKRGSGSGRATAKPGNGAKKISISVQTDLLARADALAKKNGLNRSELFAGFLAAGLARKAV